MFLNREMAAPVGKPVAVSPYFAARSPRFVRFAARVPTKMLTRAIHLGKYNLSMSAMVHTSINDCILLL